MVTILLGRYLKGIVRYSKQKNRNINIFIRPLRTREEECTFIYGEVVNDSYEDEKEEVVLDWVPPGVEISVASKYLKALPEGHVSIQGSEGAVRRRKQLEKQFPLHDVEPDNCHQLSRGEINT